MTTERSQDSPVGAVIRRNIDGFLAALGKRPRDLYEALCMPASTYSSMFKSPNGPNAATLRRIADVLGCMPSQLLEETIDG